MKAKEIVWRIKTGRTQNSFFANIIETVVDS